MPRLRQLAVVGSIAAASATSASAYVTWYTSLDAWRDATVDDVIAVTFDEPAWPVNQPLAGTWTVNNVAFSGHAGAPFPNIYVATFGSPFGSGNWLVANGDENIDIVPLAPPTAFGFDAASNDFGPAAIHIFDIDGDPIGMFVVPSGSHGFVGAISSVPIGRVNFTSILGAVADTGFDTVRLATRVALVGDINGDGVVDGADLGLLVAAWGATGPGIPSDLDCDGVVDGADLGILLGAWTG
ncbi:MAG: hypothetical protein U0575_08675 [Phycisphaerales bacterium]|jgi:hypothetical protein